MISLADAREFIRAHTAALACERVALSDALGRVLGEEVKADADYPSDARSMMDGYVVREDAVPGDFRVIGEVAAGDVPAVELGDGQAMRVFTGALLPAGTGRVVMQEEVICEGDRIRVDQFAENRFIRAKASEAGEGRVVLPAGSVLGPAEIAILAQVGAIHLKVCGRPRVRHLATGDELVAPELIPQKGQIRDTNSSMVVSLLRRMGVHDVRSDRVADDPDLLENDAEGAWDVLLISGGASVGAYDFGAETLRRLGFEIHFSRVNLRPGKPLTFASRGRQIAFVIPGNPVSHFVCFHAAIRLAFERLCGLPEAWDFVNLPLAGGEELKSDPRETLWPARVMAREGSLVIVPQRWSTSGDTFSLAGTNALALVNAASPCGGNVLTLLLNPI